MEACRIARRCNARGWFRFSVPVVFLAILASLALTAVPAAHAQDMGEYAGGTSISAGAATSQPALFSPAGAGNPNSSRFLAKPQGPPPQQLNREWFAKQAGKTGAKLTINTVPPQSSVWVDGKFVGRTPLALTLPAGEHHLSLMGPSQEQAGQTVHIVSGKPQHLEIHLVQTYPQAVSISVFGNKKK